ncbi:P22-like antirepressor protein [Rhodococcus sp. AG1013]|uniref:phage antirepressor N-terminal domain-containing protein n=1 Tax=Rhodococcus sp. AG1013 TaxID=2183996 RepID=UPI000E2BDB70|nr:phage antirepressor N-terminal domain-containing protein [Rhodococcus sp. AG1013]RDI32400.1 P22-like antirepressor protein [Rhodococcus sp. AG1013]
MNDGNALAEIQVPGSTMPMQVDTASKLTALRPMVEFFGLNYSSQLTKLKGKSWATVAKIATVGADGKTREMVGIDRRTTGMWLATLDENRVDTDRRADLRAYQAEAADALDRYFHEGVAANPRAVAPANQLDILRAAIDQIEVAQREASEAKEIANRSEARLDAIEGRHDWYSALGYARLNRITNTSTKFLNKVGRQASSIAKARGITPVKVPHQLFGEVNSYPAWIWEIAFDGFAEGDAA